MTEAPTPFFDGHNDLLLRLMMSKAPREQVWLERGARGHLDLPRMREGGFAGGLFAIFVPPGSDGPPPDFAALMSDPPYEMPEPAPIPAKEAVAPALRMAGLLHWMARAAPDDFTVCRSVAEIRAAMARGTIAGIMHMEGAEAIAPDLDALYLFHAMGLRSLGPVWSRRTAFGHGAPMLFPGDPDIGPGLTPEGKDLVRLCNELRILIDLSHLNEAGFDDVAALSDAPLVATHSNAHVHCAAPRNLTDRQLDRVRDSGGLVGLNFATFYLREDGRSARDAGWDPMMRHLDHLLTRMGEDHVGLGSDFDGCITPQEIDDVAAMPAFFTELRRRGYGEPLIAKIARENWLACLERTLGG